MARRNIPALTLEQLKELLTYEPKTGLFRWVKSARGRHAGAVAGSPYNRGYINISIGARAEKVRIYAHVLAWFYMTGEWPTQDVDHINRIKGDNRWENLRQLPRRENQQNRTQAMSNNTTGLLGAYPMKRSKTGRFFSTIFVDGSAKYLGSFDTAEQAHAAYLAAKRELHPGYAP